MFDRHTPLNALPVLPPAVEVETPAVLKKVIAASAALAELKGTAEPISAFAAAPARASKRPRRHDSHAARRQGSREVYFINRALFEMLSH